MPLFLQLVHHLRNTAGTSAPIVHRRADAAGAGEPPEMFKTVWGSVVSQLRSEPVVGPNMQLIFRHQVQPWHPSSTLTHEAALAVQQLAPDSFWDFAAALFAVQGDFFDVNVVGEPRNKTYSRLARLAAQSVDVAEDEVYALLAVPDKPAPDGSLDVGNQVTKNLTIVVKMARLVGVHVSPTVITNGIIANEITSLWTTEQWMEYLKKLVS